MQRRTSCLVLVAALAAAPLGAAEGKIPVWAPGAITQPGHYILTRNVTAMAGPALSIQADGVTLDLNGHTVMQPSATAPAIQIGGMSGAHQGIIIVGGKVEGGSHGVLYSPPSDDTKPLLLSDLIFSGQAQAAVKADGFSQLEAQGIIIVNNLVGFDLRGSAGGSPPPPIPPKALIRDADIRAGGGIHCTGVVCSIRDTAFEFHPPDPTAVSPAIRFDGVEGGEAAGIIVVDTRPVSGIIPCLLEILSSRGIVITGGKVQGPGPAAGGGDCIEVDATSSDVVIRDTTLTACSGHGIHSMGTNVTAQGIIVIGGGLDGIRAGGGTMIIDDDKILDNGGAGIWFETAGHVYRGNILRRNDGGALGGPGLTGAVDGGGNIQ